MSENATEASIGMESQHPRIGPQETSYVAPKGSVKHESNDFLLDSLPKETVDVLLAEAQRREAAKIKELVRQELVKFVYKGKTDESAPSKETPPLPNDTDLSRMIREEIARFTSEEKGAN